MDPLFSNAVLFSLLALFPYAYWFGYTPTMRVGFGTSSDAEISANLHAVEFTTVFAFAADSYVVARVHVL